MSGPGTSSASPPGEHWRPSPRQRERERLKRRLGRRHTAISAATTVVFFGVLVLLVISSAGWPTVQQTFFDPESARKSLPSIWHGFWTLNIPMFLVAEVCILVLALGVALVRGTTASALLPLRLVATGYTDVFRGIPTILLVYMLALGAPALQLTGVPSSPFFWATTALVLSYGAYVAEVFRAGIESVHPSQKASAAALGLSSGQAMRYVVVPQAVRRVVPPLLNDFASLQKDTALVSSVALFDGVFAARDYANYHFNYTPFVVAAVFFVVLTVPLARYTDWLSARAARRQRGGA